MKFDHHAIETKIGYSFEDKSLLTQAFTHPSFTNEHKDYSSYQRLEFLGDSVLGLIVSEYLFENDISAEGKLTVKKAELVSTKPLSSSLRTLGVNEYVLFGNGAEGDNDKVYEDVFEALTAAIYLDGGMEEAKSFVLASLINTASHAERDYISAIKIFAEKNKLGEVIYQFTRSGPDHAPMFVATLTIGGKYISEGSAKNKRKACQAAAKTAVENLEREGAKLEF